MMLKYQRIFSFLFFFLLVAPLTGQAGQKQNYLSLLLPAPALLEALQTILPFPVPLESPALKGTLSVDSIDQLQIHDGMISLHGVLSGKHLAVKTKIAGREISLRLGQVLLPLGADLRLRLDRAQQRLILTPKLTSSQGAATRNNEAVLLLLSALDQREYALPLKKLQALNSRIGGKNRALRMNIVNMTAKDGELRLGFRLQKSKKH